MAKALYGEVVLELVRFGAEDVIATSVPAPCDPQESCDLCKEDAECSLCKEDGTPCGGDCGNVLI